MNVELAKKRIDRYLTENNYGMYVSNIQRESINFYSGTMFEVEIKYIHFWKPFRWTFSQTELEVQTVLENEIDNLVVLFSDKIGTIEWMMKDEEYARTCIKEYAWVIDWIQFPKKEWIRLHKLIYKL